MQYTEDGTRLALATSIGIWLYDTIEFTAIYLLKGHEVYADSIAFSPDGKILATADRTGEINFWDTDTGVHQLALTIQGGIIEIVFSRDGGQFGMLDGNGSVMIWDTHTWEEEHEFSEIVNYLQQGIFSTALSPNNFSIVAGDQNGVCLNLRPYLKYQNT